MNRDPSTDEISACNRFLEDTLKIIQPKYICCLGLFAARSILAARLPKGFTLESIHGQVFEHNGTKVMCTYHPSPTSLRQHPERKQAIENDLNELVRLMRGK